MFCDTKYKAERKEASKNHLGFCRYSGWELGLVCCGGFEEVMLRR